MASDPYDVPIRTAAGDTVTLADHRDQLIMVVNVASNGTVGAVESFVTSLASGYR